MEALTIMALLLFIIWGTTEIVIRVVGLLDRRRNEQTSTPQYKLNRELNLY